MMLVKTKLNKNTSNTGFHFVLYKQYCLNQQDHILKTILGHASFFSSRSKLLSFIELLLQSQRGEETAYLVLFLLACQEQCLFSSDSETGQVPVGGATCRPSWWWVARMNTTWISGCSLSWQDWEVKESTILLVNRATFIWCLFEAIYMDLHNVPSRIVFQNRTTFSHI